MAPDAPRPSFPQMSGGVVVVIDDNQNIRELVRRALAAAHYSVLDYADPRSAINYLSRTDDAIALALIDGVMPQMLGPDVATEVQRLRPGVPVLLMSGHEAPMFNDFFGRPD